MSAVLKEIDGGAAMVRQRGISSTEYRIVGPLDSVFRAITSIFAEYHPMGYGTYVHSIRMGNSGSYEARVSHSNSCD